MGNIEGVVVLMAVGAVVAVEGAADGVVEMAMFSPRVLDNDGESEGGRGDGVGAFVCCFLVEGVPAEQVSSFTKQLLHFDSSSFLLVIDYFLE